MARRLTLLITLIVTLSVFSIAQTQRPMTPEDMWKMKRIGSLDLSPDGSKIVFSVSTYSMEANNGKSDIWIATVDGKIVKPILESKDSETSPKFSRDGKSIFFSKKGQIYSCDYNGKNIKKLTDFYSGISGIELNSSGDKFLFVSDVYPDCNSQACNKKEDLRRKNDKTDVRVITGLMFRVWDHWRGDKRSHLFLYNLANNSATDLTPNATFDVPPLDLGSGHDYGFSPDGSEVAYTTNKSKVVAISTNNDIFKIDLNQDLSKGKVVDQKISKSLGNDNQPVYSPDGKYIAFRSMKHAGFEADKSDLILYDRKSGKLKDLTNSFDRSIGEIVWSPDSKTIYFTSANYIYNSIYSISIADGKIETLVEKHVNSGLVVSPNGKFLYYKQQRSTQPYEIFALDLKTKKETELTSINKQLLSKLLFNDIETFWTKSNDGTKVQAILVKPPFFNPNKKYPLIFLIHGGPQGHWTDDFHYRWNIQQFAAPGYIVVAANPRGSVGYGQDFTNAVSGDWGGKPYEDLMSVLDNSLEKFSFIDKENIFAAGASYGGFMINWIEGHTDRFNALFSHDGVYDQSSMYGETEELWFPEWEFKGTPWTNPELYKKWSPSSYVKNFKTPMLIVQGGHDFRVPEGQAFQLFTALQRQGVESKLLYFPNETHFVTKPQNAKFWWHSLFDWFEQHKKK
jgi:dipeptidyl aminopeptidase/acylaminoacyl peptidase